MKDKNMTHSFSFCKVIMLVLLASVALPFGVQAQNVYYQRDDEVARQAAEDVAKRYGKDSLQEVDRYMEVLNQAFAKYWETAGTRSSLHSDTLSILKGEADSLALVHKAWSDSLETSKRALEEQEKALDRAADQLTARRKADAERDQKNLEMQAEEKAALGARQQALRDSIQLLRQRIQDVEGEIQALKDSLPQLSRQHADLVQQNKGLIEDIEAAQKTGQMLSDKQVVLNQVKANIDKAWTVVTSQSPLSLDAATVKKAMEDYDANRSLMASLDPSMASALAPKADVLPSYLKLSELSKQSVDQMKAILNESKNDELYRELTDLLNRCSDLSAEGRQEVRGIIDALSQQKQVKGRFVEFLDRIPNEMVCLGDESLRAELMQSRLFVDEYKQFLPGGTYYNPYYEAINLAVGKVYDDLKENGNEKIENLGTEDLFQAYFRNLKKNF